MTCYTATHALSWPRWNPLMPASTTHSPPKYIAEVRNSQEVTLYGTADLDYWERKLRPEKLVPIEQNGRARLMISAVASCWLGVRFREFMIAVLVHSANQSPAAGSTPSFYLLTAYNTSRAFSFIEQRYFQTPYSYGSVEVQCGRQPSFQLKQRTSEMLRAVRVAQPPSTPTVDEVWEGAIYLPPRPAQGPAPGKVFYARLEGLTEVSPFQPAVDAIQITPQASEPVLGWLLESEFTGREWHVRHSATHARSQTYPRR